jgi:hypothetical protein
MMLFIAIGRVPTAWTWVPGFRAIRVAGKIVRKYTLSRYPFKFMKLPCKIALFSTESSFQTAQ